MGYQANRSPNPGRADQETTMNPGHALAIRPIPERLSGRPERDRGTGCETTSCFAR